MLTIEMGNQSEIEVIYRKVVLILLSQERLSYDSCIIIVDSLEKLLLLTGKEFYDETKYLVELYKNNSSRKEITEELERLTSLL